MTPQVIPKIRLLPHRLKHRTKLKENDFVKKEPQAKNPVQGQTLLSVILDELEEHAIGCGGRGYYVVPNRNTGEPEQEQCRMCFERPDIQERLVKALRRALQAFQLMEVCDRGIKDDPNRLIAVSLIREWQNEITAILTNAGNKDKDSGTKPQPR